MANADMFERISGECPGPPTHVHPPLQGLVQDFQGDWVWLTSLAAEYPQGLCEILAEEYKKQLEKNRMPRRACSNNPEGRVQAECG